MKALRRTQDYTWDRPEFIPPRTEVFHYNNVRRILNDKSNFRVVWGEATAFIFGDMGWDFMLSGDSGSHANQRDIMARSLYHNHWQEAVKQFYLEITQRLLVEKSCRIGNVNQVDITREYVRCAPNE